MNRKSLVLTLSSLCGGVGLGLLISFLLFPPNQTNEDTSASQTPKFNYSANTEDTEELASTPPDLVDILELTSATERRHALYQLLENNSDQQIVALLERTFSLDKNQKLLSVQRVLFTELVRINPEQSLEFIWKTNRARWETLLDIVATSWSTIAPNDALQAFSLLDEPWKSKAIRTVFESQNSLSEAELKEISQSLNITEDFDSWMFEVHLQEVEDDPLVAFNFVVESELSDSRRRRVFTEITRRWIEQEGRDNISSMLNLVHANFADSWSVWDPIVREIAGTNPELVWKQLSSLSAEVQELFNNVVFRRWVERDPLMGLQAVTSDEYVDSMKSEVRYLLMAWVQAVPDQVLEHIDFVPEDLRTSVVNDAVRYLSETLPSNEVIEYLAQVRLRGISTLVATDLFVNRWSRVDPAAAVDWAVQNLAQGSGDGMWMLKMALGNLALVDPSKAMEVALNHPAEIGLEQEVVLSLIRSGELDEGLTLMSQVRKVPRLSHMYSTVSSYLIEYGRIDTAIAMGQNLDESDRQSYFNLVASHWIRFDIESMLENLPKIENAEARVMLAAGLLRLHEWDSSYLTDEELELIASLVPTELIK